MEGPSACCDVSLTFSSVPYLPCYISPTPTQHCEHDLSFHPFLSMHLSIIIHYFLPFSLLSPLPLWSLLCLPFFVGPPRYFSSLFPPLPSFLRLLFSLALPAIFPLCSCLMHVFLGFSSLNPYPPSPPPAARAGTFPFTVTSVFTRIISTPSWRPGILSTWASPTPAPVTWASSAGRRTSKPTAPNTTQSLS